MFGVFLRLGLVWASTIRPVLVVLYHWLITNTLQLLQRTAPSVDYAIATRQALTNARGLASQVVPPTHWLAQFHWRPPPSLCRPLCFVVNVVSCGMSASHSSPVARYDQSNAPVIWPDSLQWVTWQRGREMLRVVIKFAKSLTVIRNYTDE